MAGVKGRSGGPRKNSGGARPGAGRPRAKPREEEMAPIPLGDMDMLDLLQKVATGMVEASPLQVRAAIAAVQYTHPKKGEGGKKEEKADAAKEAGKKFASSPPPPLRAVK